MPRVNVVKKCRKSPGDCGFCHKPIEKGTGYQFFAFFRSSPRIRHLDCPRWKPSEMTGSGPLSQLLAAVETAESNVAAWDGDADDLKSIMEEAGGEIREAADAYGEAADNIESGFQHETSQSSEFRDKQSEVESFADEVEGFEPDEFEEEEFTPEEFEGGDGEVETDEAKTAREERNAEALAEHENTQQEARDDWAGNQREEATSLLGNCPA